MYYAIHSLSAVLIAHWPNVRRGHTTSACSPAPYHSYRSQLDHPSDVVFVPNHVLPYHANHPLQHPHRPVHYSSQQPRCLNFYTDGSLSLLKLRILR